MIGWEIRAASIFCHNPAGGRLVLSITDMKVSTKEDLCAQVEGILAVGEFYEISAGAQIIFT